MGTVWHATDQLLERAVAVKELNLGDGGGGEEPARRQRRAMREARAIARVSHPNVVGVHDLVQYEDRLWIVMELVDGPSLAAHVATAGPLPVPRTAEIGLQLLGALEAVHAAGALHRDVKPANILLRPDGSVVLTDFGIAALSDGEQLTSTGALLGSVDYMAPERLHSEPAGPPSDLFSLGATLCVLGSGQSPFARPAPAAVLHAVAYEHPQIPDRLGPLRPLVESLLSKNPADRPSSSDTAAVLRPMAVPASPAYTRTLTAPILPTSPPRPRRRRWLRWAVPTAAVLLAGSVTVGFLSARTPVRSRKVTVSALTTWRLVDLPIHKGDRVSVRYLSGTWTVDSKRPRSGPEGFSSPQDAAVTAIAGGCKVNPDMPFAALLARFSYEKPGSNHSLQQHQWAYTATAAGRLALRINDGDGCLADNAGTITVQVRVTPSS
jgi:serine/threonine protein kinase